MGVKKISARWLKASRTLKKEDQIYGQILAEMAKMHSNQVLSSNIMIKELIFAIFLIITKYVGQPIMSLSAILEVSRQVPQQHLLFI